MNPLPTPFDIIDIPYFPYEPGVWVWVVVILFFLLIITLRLRSKKEKKLALEGGHPLHDAQIAIKNVLRAASIDREDLYRLSRYIRSVIRSYEDVDCMALGPDEFERAFAKARTPQLHSLVQAVATLDHLKYQELVDEPFARELAGRVQKALEEYRLTVHLLREETYAQ